VRNELFAKADGKVLLVLRVAFDVEVIRMPNNTWLFRLCQLQGQGPTSELAKRNQDDDQATPGQGLPPVE
jgi:hypothetical protein